MTKKLLMSLAFLGGCAANSGVVPIGQDTYMVSRQAATGFSGTGTLKAEAFREANDFCVSQGKALQVVSTSAFRTDPAKVATGKKRVAEGKCASCHGPTFAGTDEVPRLAGQRPAFLRMTLRALAAGQRAHPPIEMPFYKIGDVEDIADYFAAAK